MTALECYRKAADGEEKYAQRRLGVAYEFGKSGLEVDHAKAFLSTTIRPRTVATRRRRGKGADTTSYQKAADGDVTQPQSRLWGCARGFLSTFCR